MKRTRGNIERPALIFSSDWHIRSAVPLCRTDDFVATMWRKVDFIINLSNKYGKIPVLISGDVGDKAQWLNWLLAEFIRRVNGTDIVAIPGQHDLQNHIVAEWSNCGIGVLHEAGAIRINPFTKVYNFNGISVFPFSYGVPISEPIEAVLGSRNIAMTHQLVLEGEGAGWESEKGVSAEALLEKFSQYDVILSGDNHKPFTVAYDGRLLVNPGSILRLKSDQIEHKPRVYLYYAESNRVEPVYLPIEEGVIDTTHIEEAEVKEERREAVFAYIEKLKGEIELGLDYESNCKKYLAGNKTAKEISDKLFEWIEKAKK